MKRGISCAAVVVLFAFSATVAEAAGKGSSGGGMSSGSRSGSMSGRPSGGMSGGMSGGKGTPSYPSGGHPSGKPDGGYYRPPPIRIQIPIPGSSYPQGQYYPQPQ